MSTTPSSAPRAQRALQAKRDARRAYRYMDVSRRRLQHLYDISKLLTRFHTVERTVPEVVDLLAQTLPLCSAIFILETPLGAPRCVAWQAQDESTARLQLAKAHAQMSYGYLVRSSLDLVYDQAEPLGLPSPSSTRPVALENNFVLLPLVVQHGSIFGALQIDGAVKIGEPDLAFVNAIVNQLAIAVDRQGLISARQASAEAREGEQRLFANVSAVVGSSLEDGDTLTALARAVVPEFADLCLIDHAAEDGSIRAREVLFADAEKQRDLADRLRCHLAQASSQTMQARVLLSRKPMLFSRITDLVANGIAENDEADALLSAGIKSIMAVPLLSRDRTFGVLTFATTGAGRRYSTHDLAVAEELARRASMAIDNAQLYERARRATLAREDLLAVVSHDLQNPLSVILLSIALLAKAAAKNDRAPRKELATMEHAANRMVRLIEDLLATSSIEAGRLSMTPQQLEVAPLIVESLAGLEPLAATKSVRFVNEVPMDLPALRADGARIQQVLVNLVANAIKFIPPGGTIAVRAHASADAITFSVTDTGPGISEVELPYLFDRYWQAKRPNQSGSGLGLFIVKGIVEAHGGKVWAESKLGNGATFFFTIPLRPIAKKTIAGEGARAVMPAIEGEPFLQRLPPEITAHAEEPPVASTSAGLVDNLTRDTRLRNLELHTALESTRVARLLAERAGEFRRDFMRIVSHELRGPLTALELLIERLRRDEDARATAQQQQIMERIAVALARLTATIESLLQHALNQRGPLATHIDAFDARSIATSVVEEFRLYAEEKNLELRVVAADSLPLLRNDSMLVRLILVNLVGNAIKFTQRGKVEVAVECKAGLHHLTIKDSGPGIPAADRVRIFEPFSPRDNAKQSHAPGLGLGLTLVQEIATALGGQVQLDSELGIGSTFTVTLPSLPETSLQNVPLIH